MMCSQGAVCSQRYTIHIAEIGVLQYCADPGGADIKGAANKRQFRCEDKSRTVIQNGDPLAVGA